MELYVLRHGTTPWNEKHFLQGQCLYDDHQYCGTQGDDGTALWQHYHQDVHYEEYSDSDIRYFKCMMYI